MEQITENSENEDKLEKSWDDPFLESLRYHNEDYRQDQYEKLFRKVSDRMYALARNSLSGATSNSIDSEIIPEANEDTNSKHIGVIIAISVVLMIIFQEYIR